jgi:uncharacterized RDD family membrane protein YckC
MWAEYYFGPELVVASQFADNPLILVCRENPAISSNQAFHIFRSYDGVSWNHLTRLPVSAGAVALKDDQLFVFHKEDFPVISLSAIMRGEGFETAWRYSGRYEFSWTPIIALAAGEKMYLYGYEESSQPGAGGVLREAVVAGESAHQTEFSYPLGSLAEISGCVLGRETYLFFRESASAQTRCITLPAPEHRGAKLIGNPCAFSCVSDGKSVYLFGSPREKEEKPSERLVYYTLRGEELSGPFEWNHNLRNIWGTKRKIAESSAAILGGSIFLCIRAGDEIAVAKFGEGAGNFARVARMPLSGRIALWMWSGSILGICAALILFGFLLMRSRGTRKRVRVSFVAQTAPTLRRSLALTIDVAIMLAIFLIASAPLWKDSRSLLQLLSIDHPLLLRFLALAYFAFPEAIFGQTPGKRATGIIVRTEEGERVSLWSAILRNLFKLIYFLALVEVIVALHSRRAQRLGDLTAGTVVISKAQPQTH